jgi:hypothetical protein
MHRLIIGLVLTTLSLSLPAFAQGTADEGLVSPLMNIDALRGHPQLENFIAKHL